MIKERIIRFKPVLIAAAVTTAICSYFFIFQPEKTVSISQNLPPTTIDIRYTSAQQRTPIFHTFGTVKARENSQINASVSSQVTSIPIHVGQMVQKNDVVLQLDSRKHQSKVNELQAVLKQLEAKATDIDTLIQTQHSFINHTKTQLDIAKAQKDRTLSLYEKKMVSKDELDIKESQLAAKEMEQLNQIQQLKSLEQQKVEQTYQNKQTLEQLKQAHLDLDHTQIKAPFSGQVTALHVSTGQEVSTGTPTFSLLNPLSFYLDVQIPLRHYQTLTNHNGAITGYHNQHLFTLENLQQTSEQSISISGIFTPKKPNNPLINGQTIALDVSLPSVQKTFSLPEECFYDQNTIYQVVDNALQPIHVTRLGRERIKENKYSVLFTSDILKDNTPVLLTRLPFPYAGQRVSFTKTPS